MAPARTGAHAGKRLVLTFWFLVAVFYFYLSYDYIRATMHDRDFTDYLQYIVQITGNEQRPAREVRALILLKAEELSLPVRGDQITIRGSGDSLSVVVDYNVDIEIPLIQREIYTKPFHHQANYQKVNP